MTFQASRHERNNYSVISKWNYPVRFFRKKNIHQPKNLTKQKNFTSPTKKTLTKSPIPHFEWIQNKTRFPTFHQPPSLASTIAEVMVLVPRQGCWLSKAKVQSNGKNARPRRRRAMAHGTAFDFFWLDGKKRKSLKISARMLISIWDGKKSLKKKRQVVEGCGFVSMGELWKGFFPLMMVVSIWQRESEMLSTCFELKNESSYISKKNNRNHVFWFLLLRCGYFLLLEAVPDVNATSSMKKLVFCGDNALHVGKRRRFSWSPRLTVVPVGHASKAFIHVWKIHAETNGWQLCVGELEVWPFLVGYQTASKRHVICGLCK